jgi:hypothetical protein
MAVRGALCSEMQEQLSPQKSASQARGHMAPYSTLARLSHRESDPNPVEMRERRRPTVHRAEGLGLTGWRMVGQSVICSTHWKLRVSLRWY